MRSIIFCCVRLKQQSNCGTVLKQRLNRLMGGLTARYTNCFTGMEAQRTASFLLSLMLAKKTQELYASFVFCTGHSSILARRRVRPTKIEITKDKPLRTHLFLCGTATAGLFLPNTTGAVAQTAAAPVLKAPTAWVKSLRITATAVPRTDTSELLGLNMWRFSIIAPKPTRHANFILEAEEAGKPVRRLASVRLDSQSGGWPINGHLSIFVGQYPLYNSQGGDAKARYQVRVNGFRSAPSLNLGETVSSEVEDNPLSNSDAASYGNPQRRPDGSFKLISGRKFVLGGDFGPPNVALIFRVEEESN
jgi:hypothetical protein